jgi:hypothetical protein
MAGTIFLASDLSVELSWSAASWLFDNVIEQLADAAGSPKLQASLNEIVEQRLGSLTLSDYGPSDRRLLLDLLRGDVRDRIERLPWPELAFKAPALASVDELVALARAVETS